MPRSRRRFETLEDRRLLTALVGPMAPSQSPGAELAPASAATAPASTTAASTTPASASPTDSGNQNSGNQNSGNQDSGNQDSGDQGQTDSGDTSNDSSEYSSAASPSASSGSAGDASSYDYGSSNYGSSSYGSSYEYPSKSTDSYSSPKTSSSSNSAAQASTASALLAGEEATAGQINVSSATPFAVPSQGPSPSATASPPAARSPSSPIMLEQEGGGASNAAHELDSLTEAELMPPVAMTSSATDLQGLVERAEQRAEEMTQLLARADETTPAVEFRTGSPMAGSAAINFAAIEQGIDDVFDRIERLGDDLVGRAGATRFAEWLVIAGGACAAFEYARNRFREGAQFQTSSHWSLPYEPQLRRRWFRGRSRKCPKS